MHPRSYYETYLRYQESNDVFVAIPFTPPFEDVFQNIIAVAVGKVRIGGKPLQARVVNRGISGAPDIHTQIYDGLLHARFVVADMTMQAYHVTDGRTFWQPNANVAYEVGLAAAWRNPEDILLIHQSHPEYRYSFDVQNLRHRQYDPRDIAGSTKILAEEIAAALRASSSLAATAYRGLLFGLSPTAVAYMFSEGPVRAFPALSFPRPVSNKPRSQYEEAIDELLRIGGLKARHVFPRGDSLDFVYEWTDLGLRLMVDWKAITSSRRIELRAQIDSVPNDRVPPFALLTKKEPTSAEPKTTGPPDPDVAPPETQRTVTN